MPAPYRSIGAPSEDRDLNVRRAERSAWHAHLDAREEVALMRLGSPSVEFARARVRVTRDAWVEAMHAVERMWRMGR